jgi:hypothetical protein
MLAQIQQAFFLKISKTLDTKYWKFRVLLLCVFSIFVFSFPYYKRITDELQQKPDRYLKWQQLKAQAAHPFTQIDAPPNSHQAKLTFRLTMPLLLRVLHYNIVYFYLFQAFLGIIFFWLLLNFFYKQLQDKILTSLLAFGIANIYTGASFFVDTLASCDPFAYFFLFVALAYRQPFSIFLMVQLAAWTDERGLIASCFVYLFWWLQSYKIDEKNNFITLFRFDSALLAIIGSWLTYIGLRLSLTYFLGLHTPIGNAGFEAFLENIKLTGLGVWTALEGFWFLALVLFIVLLYTREFILLGLLWVATFVVSLVAIMVYDITRSISYVYLLLPIANSILQNRIGKDELKTVLLVSTFISFLFPLYFVKQNVTYMEPIYLRVIEILAK